MAKKNTKLKWGGIIGVIVAAIAAITGAVVTINIENGKIKAEIVYSENFQVPEVTEGLDKVEYGQGEVKVEGETIPTVESVDASGPQVNPEDELPSDCPEGEECGRGAAYPYVDTSTPQAFLNATLGGCYNIDGYYDEQCWDYAALFFLNYAGRTFYTCGTGAAKGAFADGCWQKNAGDEFDWITDPTKLQPGDVVGFDNGTYGHVGIAAGYYNNGYIALQGQNQGGGLCPGSTMGARVNIINISLKHFAGAFRPKTYVKPEPTPEPTPEPEPTPTPIPVSGCVEWGVVRGDTMSKIMLECEGTVVYGEPMNAYARTWFSRNVKPGQSVYDGWNSSTGVGLYAGDWIDHKVNGE